MLGPLNIELADFSVSEKHAFLPDRFPLSEFSGDYYLPWEKTVRHLPELLQVGNLRREVERHIPILSTIHLNSEPEWQHAYVLLSFLTHSYIWEIGGPSQTLPPQISVPMIEVAAHLGLPPTATYAALNLWNFAPINQVAGLADVDNLRSLYTFTGTKDEEWFYLISVAIEAHGAPLIRCMLHAMNAVRANETSIVTSRLLQFAATIHEIGRILSRMDEHCNPDIFYNDIRPFLAGSKNMQLAGLPNGVLYELGNGEGEWHKHSGGSNAQSSIIQFFDIALGVQHHPTSGAKGSSSYLQQMRSYMPGSHRAFLQQLESVANIRQFVSRSADVEVNAAFNLAVGELASFRDIHVGIVTRYIIKPSKKSNQVPKQGMNLAVASTGSEKALQGTGGTQLLPFLLQSRNETKQTKLEALE